MQAVPGLDGGVDRLLRQRLALRTDLTGDPSFRECLGRVREVCLGAYAHQDLPFEKLVEELRPERDLGRNPLFQVMFVLQNTPPQAMQFSGVSVNLLEVERGVAPFDVTLNLWEMREGLSGWFVYNTDLFHATIVERMGRYFQILLEAVVVNPGQRLLSLPCLNEAEQRQLLMKRYKLARKDARNQLDDLAQLSNLTKNQLLVWAGQKLQPDLPLYTLVPILMIHGAVDRQCFQQAFQTLVNSSDALRTVIEEHEGVPQQRVLPPFPTLVEYLDFSQETDADAALEAYFQERDRIPADFEKGLLEPTLIKMSDTKFAWFFKIHHIITDGWSNFSLILYRYLPEFYERALRGQLEEKVELPRFQEYIDYERAYRGSPQYLQAEAYWQKKLTEECEPIAFYGKTPLKHTTAGQRVLFDLGTVRTQQLRALAAREDIRAGV